MRALILAALIIIFISIFFMLLTFNVLIVDELVCLGTSQMNPTLGVVGVIESECQLSSNFFAGIGIISLFIVIDIATLYVIFSNMLRRPHYI